MGFRAEGDLYKKSNKVFARILGRAAYPLVESLHGDLRLPPCLKLGLPRTRNPKP